MVRLDHFISPHPFEDETALGSDGVRQTTGLDGYAFFCGRPRKPRPLRSYKYTNMLILQDLSLRLMVMDSVAYYAMYNISKLLS